MLQNYLKTAIRSIFRNKFFSAINILGLAIAMSICMGIIMLVADQFEYDRYNPNGDRIFRITSVRPNGDGGLVNATTSAPVRDELLDKYTGVASAVTFKRGFGNPWLEFERHDVTIPFSGLYADDGALQMFDWKLQYGDPNTALKEPYSVVLTRAAANKLFTEENPLGKTLQVGDRGLFTVTGVMLETEHKSHIVFEALASMSTLRRQESEGIRDGWVSYWSTWVYVMLDEGQTREDLQANLDKMYQEHIVPIANRDVYKMSFSTQGLYEITPGPLMNNAIGPSLPWAFVYFLGGLSLVILLTSCFNFTNLSIARSLTRAREIGVRKVTGAARWQIFFQFISEAIVTAMLALGFALIFLLAVKPLILQLTFARVLRWDLASNVEVYVVFLVFTLVVGVLAGFFPAVVLSRFQPVKVLKSLSNMKLFSKMGLRKVLLVSQFTMSLFFIITVLVMNNQLDLFLSKDLGINIKDKLVMRLNNTSAQNLKNELLNHANIESVSAASHLPSAGMTWGDGFKKDLSEKEWTSLNYFVVDEDYLTNLNIPLLAGQFFQAGNVNNTSNIVINEEAVRALNYGSIHDAIGEEVIYHPDSTRKKIIGVIGDYNHTLLMEKIAPLALMYTPEQFQMLQIAYTGPADEAIQTASNVWASVNGNLRADIKDFEGEIRLFYDTIFGDAVHVLEFVAILAISISCMGLLGMATYTTESRVKEISIRKVLGISSGGLVFLLSRGYLGILLVSILFALPLTFFVNNLWLQLIPYHVEVDILTMITGVLALLVFGFGTIGSQTWRALFVNPVDNLKND